MTFSFKAVGSKDEVLAQLQAYDDSNFGDLGRDVRDLIASNLAATSGEAVHSADQWAVKYTVEGHGHGDANSVSFNVAVSSFWVPQTERKSDGSEVPVSSDAEQAGTSTAESAPVDASAAAQS